MRTTQSAEDRFWSKVTVGDDCWLWRGCLNNMGYGRFMLAKPKSVLAHRFAYEQQYGAIPDGQRCCHRCDTPACVRPSHLFLGTAKQNSEDMVAKGRQGFRFGQSAGRAVLSTDKVVHLRRLWGAGMPLLQLGARFGIDGKHANLIGLGKSWSHLTVGLPVGLGQP
jgi:hypothetical protein